MVRFCVEGKVLGKPRPKVNRNGRVWTPKRFADYEKKIADAYREAGGKLHEGEVRLAIVTHRSLPKSRPKKMESEPDTFKPDIDNVLKIVLDALNKVAYSDDSQVTEVYMMKSPRTRIEEHIVVEVEGRTTR